VARAYPALEIIFAETGRTPISLPKSRLYLQQLTCGSFGPARASV